MCLAVPMKLIEVRDNGSGIADLDGTRSEVNLSLLDQPKVGNYVIVHAGFAIERLDENEANIRIKLFEEMGRAATNTDVPPRRRSSAFISG